MTKPRTARSQRPPLPRASRAAARSAHQARAASPRRREPSTASSRREASRCRRSCRRCDTLSSRQAIEQQPPTQATEPVGGEPPQQRARVRVGAPITSAVRTRRRAARRRPGRTASQTHEPPTLEELRLEPCRRIGRVVRSPFASDVGGPARARVRARAQRARRPAARSWSPSRRKPYWRSGPRSSGATCTSDGRSPLRAAQAAAARRAGVCAVAHDAAKGKCCARLHQKVRLAHIVERRSDAAAEAAGRRREPAAHLARAASARPPSRRLAVMRHGRAAAMLSTRSRSSVACVSRSSRSLTSIWRILMKAAACVASCSAPAGPLLLSLGQFIY